MENSKPHCVRCSVLRCGSKDKSGKVPASCPTEKYAGLAKKTVEKYQQPENQAIMKGWLGLMSNIFNPRTPKEKWSWTRIDEVMEYARQRGMKRLGIATCYMLIPESKLLSDILEDNGFEVISVSCLCGEVDPKEIGLPGNVSCNPIMQAEVLDQEKTELNIMMGLCVGHDILFLKHSKAETTPLVVKDRAMGHNPIAALYLSKSFYKGRFTRG